MASDPSDMSTHWLAPVKAFAALYAGRISGWWNGLPGWGLEFTVESALRSPRSSLHALVVPWRDAQSGTARD